MLIDSLRRKGISDESVLGVMNEIPREKFVAPAFINRAYDDCALPIDYDQTISQPYTVAYMTSLLNINEGDKILEIGTGSGYQACVLYMLGAKVFTIERILELFEKSRRLFDEFGMHIVSRFGDGTLGWREFSPYKGIIITAASPKVPQPLLDQLSIGGRMVIPVGDKESQVMHVIERATEKDYREYKTDKFKFVPLIGKEGWESDL